MDIEADIPRFRVSRGARARDLLAELQLSNSDDVTLTFIVDEALQIWVAERHSEHVACARGRPVLAAGEMLVDLSGGQLEVVSATNQSTGYCPGPESWLGLVEALDAIEIKRPDGFETEFRFGRCLNCDAIAIVKDGDHNCVECGGVLKSLHS